MSPWVRLLEKLTRTPHRLDDSARVRIAAEELKESSSKLSRTLHKLLESPDPIAALSMYSRSEFNR
jgi:hypothetical protein